ncbi:MAG TPA: thioesterase family protein [Bacteroidota bacterium]|nr:thioesterase family protein [Bacteroidota bacterium]
MITNVSQIRVRYADTDQMKFVYYGKYFEYFEQGRSDLLRAIGLPYAEIEKQGIFLPVVEAFAKFRQSARYDDLINIETMVAEMPESRVRITYNVYREGKDEVLVEGYTVHSFVNAQTGRATRAPGMFLHALERAFQQSKEPYVEKRTA